MSGIGHARRHVNIAAVPTAGRHPAAVFSGRLDMTEEIMFCSGPGGQRSESKFDPLNGTHVGSMTMLLKHALRPAEGFVRLGERSDLQGISLNGSRAGHAHVFQRLLLFLGLGGAG